jgi:2-amino-4-hydroxy-6-hydroxymethyldihydropteridine diphosphokinase
MPNLAYLSLGSNIEPEHNLRAALNLLAGHTKLRTVSSVWETKPVGTVNQPNYLNAAAIVETSLTAEQLKRTVIDQIERGLSRVRQVDKNAPRTIDIDIVLFNHQIFELGHRHIPDPELLERPFLAVPMAEIAPNYQHPETGQSLIEIARSFDVNEGGMRLRPDLSKELAQNETY